MNEHEERFMNIEMALANAEKTIEDINAVVINQAKIIDFLVKQNQNLMSQFEKITIRSAEEETRPPHY